jgi:8-oxo-dGTP diphosphatase
MPLARFVALHDVPEQGMDDIGQPRFAVMIARAPGGVVLVFNRFRRVWELPGGLIDPGDTPRDCALRELREEAGCEGDEVEWLGLLEVDDGRRHLGAVYACRSDSVPSEFESEETTAIMLWRPDRSPSPLGDSDSALLFRFGAGLQNERPDSVPM